MGFVPELMNHMKQSKDTPPGLLAYSHLYTCRIGNIRDASAITHGAASAGSPDWYREVGLEPLFSDK